MPQRPVIAVLGGGHAAFAHAADLTLRGFEVRLCELPALAETIAAAQAQGGILSDPFPSTGLDGGFAAMQIITTDFALALAGAQIIFLVVPAFAHAAFAQQIAPHVQPDQIVVLSPASFGGALLFARSLADSGCVNQPMLCEAQSMMYACRKSGPAAIRISGVKEGLRMAVFPARHTDAVMAVVRQIFPTVQNAPNILWTWLSNPNPIGHPPITILTAGWTEQTGGDFLFYLEGGTPSVYRVVEDLDAERMQIGAALGLALEAHEDLPEIWYGHQARRAGTGQTPRQVVYASIKAEKQLDSRYLTEDLPYGLVPWEDMGRLAGVKTPLISSLINLGNALLGRGFRAEGLTLARLGLDGLTANDLLALVQEGGLMATA